MRTLVLASDILESSLQPISTRPAHYWVRTSPRPYIQSPLDKPQPPAGQWPPHRQGLAVNWQGPALPMSMPKEVSPTTREGPMWPIQGAPLYSPGDQKGECCWDPQDISYIRPLLQDWETSSITLMPNQTSRQHHPDTKTRQTCHKKKEKKRKEKKNTG